MKPASERAQTLKPRKVPCDAHKTPKSAHVSRARRASCLRATAWTRLSLPLLGVLSVCFRPKNPAAKQTRCSNILLETHAIQYTKHAVYLVLSSFSRWTRSRPHTFSANAARSVTLRGSPRRYPSLLCPPQHPHQVPTARQL